MNRLRNRCEFHRSSRSPRPTRSPRHSSTLSRTIQPSNQLTNQLTSRCVNPQGNRSITRPVDRPRAPLYSLPRFLSRYRSDSRQGNLRNFRLVFLRHGQAAAILLRSPLQIPHGHLLRRLLRYHGHSHPLTLSPGAVASQRTSPGRTSSRIDLRPHNRFECHRAILLSHRSHTQHINRARYRRHNLPSSPPHQPTHTLQPNRRPSDRPTRQPTQHPTCRAKPSVRPFRSPSLQPYHAIAETNEAALWPANSTAHGSIFTASVLATAPPRPDKAPRCSRPCSL